LRSQRRGKQKIVSLAWRKIPRAQSRGRARKKKTQREETEEIQRDTESSEGKKLLLLWGREFTGSEKKVKRIERGIPSDRLQNEGRASLRALG